MLGEGFRLRPVLGTVQQSLVACGFRKFLQRVPVERRGGLIEEFVVDERDSLAPPLGSFGFDGFQQLTRERAAFRAESFQSAMPDSDRQRLLDLQCADNVGQQSSGFQLVSDLL